MLVRGYRAFIRMVFPCSFSGTIVRRVPIICRASLDWPLSAVIAVTYKAAPERRIAVHSTEAISAGWWRRRVEPFCGMENFIGNATEKRII